MTNHKFNADCSIYCDNDRTNHASIINNGDSPLPQTHQHPPFQPSTESDSKIQSNIVSKSMIDNLKKTPPYVKKPSSNDIESNCERTTNNATSTLSLLHMIAVVISSAIINGVVFGVVNNFGVFYVSLIDLFKSDTSLLVLTGSDEQLTNDIATNDNSTVPSDSLLQPLIAGVGSLNIGLIFFCSIFASVLSDRYGIRSVCLVGGVLSTIGMYASSVSVNLIYLYITYGLVLGIGASLVYAPSLAILGHYFTTRLGLVNGLVTAGSSGFSIVMPIILRMLINQHGIQNTFKYLTFLMASLILCSLTFKERIPKMSKSEKCAPTDKRLGSRVSLSNLFLYDELWKNRLYLCWLISIPTGLFGYFVPFCHLVKHAQDIQSEYPGEVLVMFIGIFSLVGRLISGPLADFSHINRIALQMSAFVSIGIITMMLPLARGFFLLSLCCGLGLFDGCFISLLGPIAFDLVGPEFANQAIGLLLCFCSLPLTTGPPIAAYAYGIYGNYNLAFVLAGFPPLVAALLMINIIRLQRNRSRTFSALRPMDNMQQVGFICENGEKLHLLTNNSINGNNSNNSSVSKLKQNENSSTSLDNTNNEQDLLLTKSQLPNHVIQPISTQNTNATTFA